MSLPADWLRTLLQEEADRAGVALDELLTLEQVAEHVGRAVSTVGTWANGGKLPGAFRLFGRDWRVPESALQDFIRAQQVAKEAPSGSQTHRPVDLGSWRRVRANKGKAA